MFTIERARDLLQAGETAVVIFTRGSNFQIHADGTGVTGYWKVMPQGDVDQVIVYHRQPDKTNKVYTAKPVAVRGPDEEDRYSIELSAVQQVGSTEAKWFQFAETQANPVRYLSQPA
jgi:hypothetical protein